MAPRRRKNIPPDRESPRPPSPSPDRVQSPEEADESSDSPLPFYNTTFSAHRVSPLYLGTEPLTAHRLQVLTQRLRDRLIGDVVRGVEVGLGPDGEDPVMGRAGALEEVEMRWVSVADLLDMSHNERAGGHPESDGMEVDEDGAADWRRSAAQLRRKTGVQISLRYEMAQCTALLLPSLTAGEDSGADAAAHTRFSVAGAGADVMDWEQSVDPAHFLSLPLLLLRMPAPLKAVICDFLSVTFDCRVSPMRLGTRSLVRSWEAWVRSAGLPSRGPLAKDLVVSLGFYVPQPERETAASGQVAVEEGGAADSSTHLGLKSVDVIIPASELRRFVAAGRRLAGTQKPRAATGWGWEDDSKERQRLAGRLYEEGWEWRTATAAGDDGVAEPGEQPFTEALGCYLNAHLGLNLFHPGVRIIKIACGGFVMSEGRLKLFGPAEGEAGDRQRGAASELLDGLVEKAQAQGVLAF